MNCLRQLLALSLFIFSIAANGQESTVAAKANITGGLTCQSREVREAIDFCFRTRPNCPLNSYCSAAYEWYAYCSPIRPNRYCFGR